MGVYIKGMKMPTVCVTEDGWFGNCPMDRTWCQQRFAPPETTMGEAYKARLGKLPEWCPLVSVPPHGDLIDADALIAKVGHDTPLSDVYEKTMRRYLENAPTIIPAEEEEWDK